MALLKSKNSKAELYVLSLWLFFIIAIIANINIPLYFGHDWTFVGILPLIKMNIIPLISLFFLIMGTLSFFRFKYKLLGSNNLPEEVISKQNKSFEHLTFLTTYVIPLIFFNFQEDRQIIILAIMLFVIGLIYIKTDIFYANPTLALLGFHIYKVKVKSVCGEKEKIVMMLQAVRKGDKILTKRLDENIFFGKVDNGR